MILPEIDPVAIQLGPLAIRWYSLSWLAAFGLIFFFEVQVDWKKIIGDRDKQHGRHNQH